MRGCLQATAVRRMRAREGGPGYPPAPPHRSARSPQLAVATL